jgi:dihydroorotate dehydrogenase (fumarate)
MTTPIDLTTGYLGLRLRSPVVASASPLSRDVDTVRRMEEAGAGAVVLDSLFEEQVTLEQRTLNSFLLQGTEHFAEALSYFPEVGSFHFAPDRYLERIVTLKHKTDLPIIGSLNGTSAGGWLRYATQMEEAGADGLELNIYYLPTDPATTSQAVEDNYVDLVRELRGHVRIPIAIKLCPFLTSTPAIAARLAAAGADALVMFNRFYQPDFDLHTLTVSPNLQLSTSRELRLRLRWIALLYGVVDAQMALTGGVHTAEDVIKSIAAGATVAMTTSSLLKKGIGHMATLLEGLSRWMEQREYASVAALRGVLSHESVEQPGAFVRANYLRVLASYVPERGAELGVESHR